jgi:hypothetical protein
MMRCTLWYHSTSCNTSQTSPKFPGSSSLLILQAKSETSMIRGWHVLVNSVCQGASPRERELAPLSTKTCAGIHGWHISRARLFARPVTVDEGITPPASAAEPCVKGSLHTAPHPCGACHAHRRRAPAVCSTWPDRWYSCQVVEASLPPGVRGMRGSTSRTSPALTASPPSGHRRSCRFRTLATRLETPGWWARLRPQSRASPSEGLRRPCPGTCR